MEENLREVEERIRTTYCPDMQRNIRSVEDTLDVLQGKWKVRILMAIMKGNYRFKELLEWNVGLTDKVLSHNLKILIEDKLIEKFETASFPPMTEYRMTEHGVSLYKVMAELMRWGEEHRRYVLNK